MKNINLPLSAVSCVISIQRPLGRLGGTSTRAAACAQQTNASTRARVNKYRNIFARCRPCLKCSRRGHLALTCLHNLHTICHVLQENKQPAWARSLPSWEVCRHHRESCRAGKAVRASWPAQTHTRGSPFAGGMTSAKKILAVVSVVATVRRWAREVRCGAGALALPSCALHRVNLALS